MNTCLTNQVHHTLIDLKIDIGNRDVRHLLFPNSVLLSVKSFEDFGGREDWG